VNDSRFSWNSRFWAAVCCMLGFWLTVSNGTAQTFPAPDYFHQLFFPPPVALAVPGPTGLRQYTQYNRLQLTLQDAVQLALLNNTNVRIDRLAIRQSEYNLAATYAPFDPAVTNSFTSSRTITPATNTLEGAQTIDTLFQLFQSQYSQTLQTGTNYTVTFNGSKGVTNSFFYFLNPYLTSALTVQLTQPLLRNRGLFANQAPIMIARRNLEQSRESFEAQVSNLLQQVITDYWNVVEARENLHVAESSLEQARASYEHDEKALKLGALPQVNIYRSEAQVAQRRVAVIQQQASLKQYQDQFREDIGADLDPSIESLPLDLAESPEPKGKLAAADRQSAVQEAMERRPELQSLHQRLEADRLNVRYQHNQMLPDLELSGNYAGNGIGGAQIPSTPGAPAIAVPNGFAGTLGQLFGFHYPTYGFGLTLRLPIRNHAAEAALGQAAVARETDLYAIRLEQQTVNLDVTNSVHQLDESKQALAAAKISQDLAQKTLQAEELKYRLGTEQIYFVLEAQTELAQAEQSVVQAEIGYQLALTAVDHAKGTLLDRFHIQLAP
jgi:outer membrane protein